MRLFISWSGERSQALAHVLRDWFPLVLHYVEPWLSEADVAAGERWAQAIAKELEASNFGVICVTRENVGSPWVLFEAGALAKSMEGSRVVPLLLDLEFSDITGPLAQFQAKKVERSGLAEVVQSINQAAGQPVPEARARQLFDALWPEFEKQLAAVPHSAPATGHLRSQNEILEELVTGVRSLDSRFRDIESVVAGDSLRSRRSRKRRPVVMREMMHRLSDTRDDPVSLLFMLSLLRDDLPWLYELGVDAYRATKAGPSEESERSLRQLQRAVDLMLREGSYEEFADPKALHLVLREVLHLLDVEQQKGTQSPAILSSQNESKSGIE
jgi:hypothetical protein